MPTSRTKPPSKPPSSRRSVSLSHRSADEGEFRHYLKEWRQHRGLSQEQLAKALNTSKGEVSRYERGERTLSLLIQFRLMRALRITPGQFFSPPDAQSADALLTGLSPEERARYIAALQTLIGPKAP
jgi:transcriptional regulator with XRE-family HTH domain